MAIVLSIAPAALAADPPNTPLTAMQDAVSILYSYSLKIVGLAVFVMFLLAGLVYIIPALKTKFGEPWPIIQDAIIGLILLFSAYLILNTINPDLVRSPTVTPAATSNAF